MKAILERLFGKRCVHEWKTLKLMVALTQKDIINAARNAEN